MHNLEHKKYWIWLSLIDGLGSVKKQKLLEKYHTPENIYKLEKKELLKVSGIGEKLANSILDKSLLEKTEKHIEYMIKNEIDIISIYDKEYPQILREIYSPPISLYIKGNKNILNSYKIAIIGSRKPSEYGKKATEYFSYNLAKNNITIVSGLARGIDSISHLGAIASKGKTIAVVGNGLDIVYPKENEILEEEIVNKDGCIISEYSIGTKPEKMNFPARNRIISGISNSVLVVEAKRKSGTLITVDFALEQGREVYAVPGNINSENSLGTNDLIKQGAKLVNCFEDCVEKDLFLCSKNDIVKEIKK